MDGNEVFINIFHCKSILSLFSTIKSLIWFKFSNRSNNQKFQKNKELNEKIVIFFC